MAPAHCVQAPILKLWFTVASEGSVQQEEMARENDGYDQLLVPDVIIEDNEEKTIYPTEKKVETSLPSKQNKVIENHHDYYLEDFSSCEFNQHSMLR